MPATDTPRLLRFAEIAERTGVPVETLRYWRKRGEGPPMFCLGRRLVAYEDEVERWIAAQRERAAADARARDARIAG